MTGGLLAALLALVTEIVRHLPESTMSLKDQVADASKQIQNAAEKGADALAADITIASLSLAKLAGAGKLAEVLAGVIVSVDVPPEARESMRTLLVAVQNAMGDTERPTE